MLLSLNIIMKHRFQTLFFVQDWFHSMLSRCSGPKIHCEAVSVFQEIELELCTKFDMSCVKIRNDMRSSLWVFPGLEKRKISVIMNSSSEVRILELSIGMAAVRLPALQNRNRKLDHEV